MAKATYDSAGLTGAFSKDNMNNQFHSLYQGDSAPLRPRAQAAPNMTVAVTSAIAESFYGNIWLNNIASATYAGGNSPAISAPSANPRIDLLYLNSAGALAWLTGTESGSPAAKSFAGYTGIPICLVYCKTTMIKIVNYEDTGANPNEGYIYKDIRPQISPVLDIASMTEKTALVNDDLFLIEDSESSNVKKKVKKSNVAISLGNWDTGAPWVKDTAYLAATDGFVLAYKAGDAIYGYTDSSNPPTTKRIHAVTSFCMPVKKGHYWKVTADTTVDVIYWIPLGS